MHAESLEVRLTVPLNNDAWFLTDLEGVPIHPDSVAFIFGAVLMVSGSIFYKYISFLQNYCCKKMLLLLLFTPLFGQHYGPMILYFTSLGTIK